MTDKPKRSSRSPKKVGGGWDLDDGTGYDENHFYVGSRDKGTKDTITITVNVPMSVHHFIEEVLDRKLIPEYRTKKDFYRDAIWHRLNKLKEKLANGERSEELEQSLAVLLTQQRALQSRQRMRDRAESVEDTRAALEDAVRLRERGEFLERLTDAERNLVTWPDCGAKDELEAIVKRYRQMVNEI